MKFVLSREMGGDNVTEIILAFFYFLIYIYLYEWCFGGGGV